ncbi:VOC family protein [Henriciella aquimarina]|uniref:VOC family protein n=1 Tax=Henriciella aquimarina TaxID=545261 RepID=UPI000A02012B|nr:VOC family protein [Henriciella aquimarina]
MSVDEIRYKRLGYVALTVTDLETSRYFYETLVGLKMDKEPADGVAFLRCSGRHHDLVLYQGGEPALKRVAWQMESDNALKAAREHLAELDIECVPVSPEEQAELGIGEAFRASEPTTGATFEFYCDMAEAPCAYEPTHTKIARLGHVVLSSPDREATENFLMEDLNFRVSDRIKGVVTFMRCFPNRFHHSLGVGAAKEPGLNHVNFMVTEMADVGKANNRMKKAEVPIVYGIGKHPPSESVFIYFLDPDGMTVEYSYGMEEFPENAPRDPREMPASLESIDYWEGVPDPRMAKVGALEALTK